MAWECQMYTHLSVVHFFTIDDIPNAKRTKSIETKVMSKNALCFFSISYVSIESRYWEILKSHMSFEQFTKELHQSQHLFKRSAMYWMVQSLYGADYYVRANTEILRGELASPKEQADGMVWRRKKRNKNRWMEI